jgi:hypothetical protein
MKNLNVRRNVQKRNFFQNVLKRSQKINVNVQNSIICDKYNRLAKMIGATIK